MPHPLALAWFLFFFLVLGLAVWIAVFGNPNAGGPQLVVQLSHPEASGPAPKAARAEKSAPPKTETAESEPEIAAPPPVVPQHIDAPVYAGKALVADPALIQQTDQGPLPRIADDGREPMTAYAAPAPSAKGPKIAIVVNGLGISAKATSTAIDNLPSGVTLAFAPYADDVQRWVSEARRKGHEVLLEVPMEPYDFPDSDPGPHTLRAASGEDANLKRLVWSLTRFTGYVGVTNLLGGRFLADSDSLAPVMTFLSRRGLMFFDSGSATRSVSADVAGQAKTAYATGAVSLDRIQTSMEIDQRLSELEARARKDGFAAATGFVYPVTIDRIAQWAKGLQGRGFTLVPVSAIATRSQ